MASANLPKGNMTSDAEDTTGVSSKKDESVSPNISYLKVEIEEHEPWGSYNENSSSSDAWPDCSDPEVMNLESSDMVKSKAVKHKERPKVVCHICGYLARADLLRQHILNKHDTSKVYKCTQCDHTTNCKSYLRRHFKLNHSAVSELLTCTYCDYITHNALHLKKHIGNNHKQIGSYSRGTFGLRTTENISFPSYINNNRRTENKIHKCKDCLFETNWQSHLYLHIKNKHTLMENVYHKCKECAFETRWKSHLYKHMKDKHVESSVVEYYGCQYCLFQTRWQSHLYKHRKTNHPEIVFQRNQYTRVLVNKDTNHVIKTYTHGEAPLEDFEEIIEKCNVNNMRVTRTRGRRKNCTAGKNENKRETKENDTSGTFNSLWQSFFLNFAKQEAANFETEHITNTNKNSLENEETEINASPTKHGLRRSLRIKSVYGDPPLNEGRKTSTKRKRKNFNK